MNVPFTRWLERHGLGEWWAALARDRAARARLVRNFTRSTPRRARFGVVAGGECPLV